MLKKSRSILATLCLLSCLTSCGETSKEEIKAVIFPKFENGELYGDDPGEAQHYFEYYCQGGKEYEITGGYSDHKFYVKNGVALYVTGEGKNKCSFVR